MNPITGIVGGLGILALVAAYSFGSGYVEKLETLTRENEKKDAIIRVLEAREISYKTRIDTRDRAIAQSKCSKQIQGWVLKPSTLPSPIPKPFSLPGT